MYPSQHLFYGTIFALVLLFLFPYLGWIGFFVIIFSTVLIDVDHYLYYVYKKKDWNLRRAYDWFILKIKKYHSFSRQQRDGFYIAICFLHGFEFLIILFLLGFFYSITFFYIFVGFSFHLLLDLVDETIHKERIDRISPIHNFFKFKKLKFIEDI